MPVEMNRLPPLVRSTVGRWFFKTSTVTLGSPAAPQIKAPTRLTASGESAGACVAFAADKLRGSSLTVGVGDFAGAPTARTTGGGLGSGQRLATAGADLRVVSRDASETRGSAPPAFVGVGCAVGVPWHPAAMPRQSAAAIRRAVVVAMTSPPYARG